MAEKKKSGFVQLPFILPRVTISEWAIFSVIRHFETMEKGCIASVCTIGEVVGLCERQTRYILKSLEEKGFIRRTLRPGETTQYKIVDPDKTTQPPEENNVPQIPEEMAQNPGNTLPPLPRQYIAPHPGNTLPPNNIEKNNIETSTCSSAYNARAHILKKTTKKKEKIKLENLIDFPLRNPEYKNGKDKDKNGKNIFPVLSSAVEKIYQAGLKIGYRMTIDELYKFCYVVGDGYYYDKKRKPHKVRDFNKLLRTWKENQTPEMAIKAESDAARLKAGEEIWSGEAGRNWGRVAPLPELDEIDKTRNHPLYTAMNFKNYYQREYYIKALKEYEKLSQEEQKYVLDVVRKRGDDEYRPDLLFDESSKHYWKKHDYI